MEVPFAESAAVGGEIPNSNEFAPPESDTAWIGGIPDGFCQGDIDEVNKALAESCKQFGEVISATVRLKPGINKSWALCTFKGPASAHKCVAEGMTLPDGYGNQIAVKCKISDVESNLKKGTTGALASMANKQGMLKTLSEHAQAEDQQNKKEFELRTGQPIAYGDKIQLLNSMAMEFIQGDKQVAAVDKTALRVNLCNGKHGRNKGCLWEIMAGFRTRQEGEPVRIGDPVVLSSVMRPGVHKHGR